MKKGELFLDNNSVAKVEKVDKKYQFSDLSGNVMFSALITQQTALQNYGLETWLELTGANGIVRELELPKKLKFTLSNEKYNIDAVLKSETNLLSVNGFNKEAINSFFQTQERPYSEKWDALFEEEKTKINEENELAKRDGISIDSKGNILKGNEKIGVIVRSITKDNSPNSLAVSIYKVGDLSGGRMASSEFNSMEKEYYPIKTYDQKSFKIFAPVTKQDASKPINEDPLAKRIVYRLYANKYPFGNMTEVYKQYVADANQEINQQNKALEDKAKNESLNIYDTWGYLIDNSGKKYEGLITIEFESIDQKLGREKNVSNLSSFGNSVTLKREGEKNKYFKAKDGAKFCAGNTCFLGTKSEEDGYFGHGGSQFDALSGGASQFFQILYEKDGNYVLAHVKHPEDYYLKLKNNDKAVYLGDKMTFGKKSPERLKKIFDKYVKCSALDFSKYDTTSKESMIQIVDDYINSCK